MTCIEVDGDSHAEQIEYDQARTAHLNELGYAVIRFTNRKVFNQCEAVLHHIAEEWSGLLKRQRFDSQEEMAIQSWRMAENSTTLAKLSRIE